MGRLQRRGITTFGMKKWEEHVILEPHKTSTVFRGPLDMGNEQLQWSCRERAGWYTVTWPHALPAFWLSCCFLSAKPKWTEVKGIHWHCSYMSTTWGAEQHGGRWKAGLERQTDNTHTTWFSIFSSLSVMSNSYLSCQIAIVYLCGSLLFH